jgi:hypothetical protein
MPALPLTIARGTSRRSPIKKRKDFRHRPGVAGEREKETEGEENTKTPVFKRQSVGSFDLVVNSSFHVPVTLFKVQS